MIVGILSGSHAAEDHLQNQSEQLFKQANERLEQPAPAWKDSPTGCSRSRASSALSTKIRITSCHAVAGFLSLPEPWSFLLHRVQCVVSLYDILLQRYLFMNLFHSVFSGIRVTCIVFYFAYYIKLNLTQKISEDPYPEKSQSSCTDRLLTVCRQRKYTSKRHLRFISSCYCKATSENFHFE